MRTPFSIALTVAFAAIFLASSTAARATDIRSLDVSGVKLGMTVDDARAALKAKIGPQDASFDKDEHDVMVDCTTGVAVQKTASDPNATVLDNAIAGLLTKKTKKCVGGIVITFEMINVEVDFQAQDGRWDDPRASAVHTRKSRHP